MFSKIVGINGKVYAFEPFDSNITFLQKHIIINRLSNTILQGCAVSNIDGEVVFFPNKSSSMGTIIEDDYLLSQYYTKVPAITLDNFVYDRNNLAPDLIKMDIEGAEALALSGMRKLLNKKKPIIFIALHGEEKANNCFKILKPIFDSKKKIVL
jgi:FkbM family methyltransferase